MTLRGLEGVMLAVTFLPQVFLAFAVIFLPGRQVVAQLLNQVALAVGLLLILLRAYRCGGGKWRKYPMRLGWIDFPVVGCCHVAR